MGSQRSAESETGRALESRRSHESKRDCGRACGRTGKENGRNHSKAVYGFVRETGTVLDIEGV